MADQERENREEERENRENEGSRQEESPVRPDRESNTLTPEKEELADVEPGQSSRPEGSEDEDKEGK